MLFEWGANTNDVIEAIRSGIRVKNQRRRTIHSIGTYDRIEERLEKASRKIKRGFLRKSSTSQQEMMTDQGFHRVS